MTQRAKVLCNKTVKLSFGTRDSQNRREPTPTSSVPHPLPPQHTNECNKSKPKISLGGGLKLNPRPLSPFREKTREQLAALKKHHEDEIEHHEQEIERLQKQIERHRKKMKSLKHNNH